MNVLVIAPHPDDETIGCGGAVRRHARQGDRVSAVFLTSGELGLKELPREKAWAVREEEAKVAANILGIRQLHFLRLPDWFVGDSLKGGVRLLRPLLVAEEPQLIYVPHEAEWHPDHQAALPLLRLAFSADQSQVPELRAYEVWTPLAVHDHVENISGLMRWKIKALRAYRSQLGAFNYERAVRGLNAFRGELAAKCRYAEVFRTTPLETRA